MLMRLFLISLLSLAFSRGAYSSAADDLSPVRSVCHQEPARIQVDVESVNLAWSECESLPERNCNKVENTDVTGPVSMDSGLKFLSYSTLQQIIYSRRKVSLISHYVVYDSGNINKSPVVNFLRI